MSLEETAAKAFLGGLQDRFRNKIDPENYALSYSGGKDSHLLWWFIKEWLHEDRITIVGVNSGFEIPEIRNRILANSDVVLHPQLHRREIKERFGIPCFSKHHDDYIYRYQHGNRSVNTMNYIEGKNPVLKLNKRARSLLLSGQLHPISNKCCVYNKEKSLQKWQKENGKKPIIGIRQAESMQRKNAYHTCLNLKTGAFTPLYDWTDDMVDLVYRVYKIPIPECYQYLERTGCAGCPYGRHVELELSLLPELQRKASIDFFRESYDVLGVDYNNIQQTMYEGEK